MPGADQFSDNKIAEKVNLDHYWTSPKLSLSNNSHLQNYLNGVTIYICPRIQTMSDQLIVPWYVIERRKNFNADKNKMFTQQNEATYEWTNGREGRLIGHFVFLRAKKWWSSSAAGAVTRARYVTIYNWMCLEFAAPLSQRPVILLWPKALWVGRMEVLSGKCRFKR